MKYLENYPYGDLQIKESIRQTKRAANKDDFDLDEPLTMSERIVYWLILVSLVAGWLEVFSWAFEK